MSKGQGLPHATVIYFLLAMKLAQKGNFHEPPKVVNSLSGSIAGMARRRRSSALRQSCLQHEPIRVKMQ
jgi:hypothetical protein